MAHHLIVPVDESPESWRAFDVARSLAARCDGYVRIVEIAWDPADGRNADARLKEELQKRGPFDVDVSVEVRLTTSTVAAELETLLSLHPGALVVMASHGRGRSAAILGSVAKDMLQRTTGPLLLVGPNVEPDDFSGPVVAAVDGSDESEAALDLAASWAKELGSTPWIVSVGEPSSSMGLGTDLFDTAYPARLARELKSRSGHNVEFEELHDKRPAEAVADYASRREASMIVASSHGRSGLSRLAVGSVASGFVRHATCPVMVMSLTHPHAATAPRAERMWAY